MRDPLVALLPLLFLASCASGPERGLPPATALERRGESLLAEGHVEEARVVFGQVLREETGPRFIALIGNARCEAALGNWPGFERAMRAAMAVMPQTPDADDLVGRTLLDGASHRSGQAAHQGASMAASFFTRARRRAPGIPGLAYHMGMCRVVQERPREAVPYFEQSLRERPQGTRALRMLVRILRELGSRERLRVTLEALEKADLLPAVHLVDLEWSRIQRKKEGDSRPVKQ